MKANLQSPVEWHKRYDNVDGTGEMFMGAMLLGFALLSYLQSILPNDSLWRINGFASLLFMYAVLASVMAPAYLIRRIIKRRITFPRSGYVALGVGAHHQSEAPGDQVDKFRKSRRAAFIAIIASSIIIGGVTMCVMGFATRYHGALPWLAVLCDIAYLGMWLLLYAFWIWRMGGHHQWKWFLLLPMAVGLILIGIFHTGNFIQMSRPVSLLVGLIWVASGIGTFCSYLRHTHSPAPAAE